MKNYNIAKAIEYIPTTKACLSNISLIVFAFSLTKIVIIAGLKTNVQ